jgi:uncharacterized protein (UPF0276 family)
MRRRMMRFDQMRFDRKLGLGIGWRPDLAHFIAKRGGFGFVEVLAENLETKGPLPRPLAQLKDLGLCVIPHGVSLSLGGAEPIEPRRVEHLARLAEKLGSPLVSEHLAFVRADGIEVGHLTPLPRTRDALEVLVENIETARRLLPVPLALENIAALFEWPDTQMAEHEFVTTALEQTDTLLLLDISNAYANAHNRGVDALAELLRFPLDRLAYVHMGGGIEHDGIVHDTHAAPLLPGALDLLRRFCQKKTPPGVMLEHDENFPAPEELAQELARITEAMAPTPTYAG